MKKFFLLARKKTLEFILIAKNIENDSAENNLQKKIQLRCLNDKKEFIHFFTAAANFTQLSFEKERTNMNSLWFNNRNKSNATFVEIMLSAPDLGFLLAYVCQAISLKRKMFSLGNKIAQLSDITRR